MEQFDEFDEQLKTHSVREELINGLCLKISGADKKTIINGMVQCLMSNALQAKFSWKGQRGKKRGLLGTEVYNALVEAIRKSVKDQLRTDLTESELGKCLGVCLIQAIHRKK